MYGGNLRNRKTRAAKLATEPTELNTSTNNNRIRYRPVIFICVTVGFLCVFAAIWSCMDISPISYKLDEPVSLINQLEITYSNGERIAEGLDGPESVDIDSHGNLYAGLDDGRIVKIHPNDEGSIGKGVIETLFNSGGRPVGLRIHDNNLYVVNLLHGLYVIDLNRKSIKNLVQLDSVTPPLKAPNDLTITNDGKVLYFTDTSSKWSVLSVNKEIMEGHCTGRIFKLTTTSSKIEEFATGLCSANGIQLSHDEQMILVSEMMGHRVRIIDIQSKKTVKIVDVPGTPDNIRLSKNGGYWVALAIPRSPAIEILGEWPTIRKLIYLILPQGRRFQKFISYFTPGLAVKLSYDGSVVKSIVDWKGKLSRSISQVTETQGGELILTSYIESFLVKLITDN